MPTVTKFSFNLFYNFPLYPLYKEKIKKYFEYKIYHGTKLLANEFGSLYSLESKQRKTELREIIEIILFNILMVQMRK